MQTIKSAECDHNNNDLSEVTQLEATVVKEPVFGIRIGSLGFLISTDNHCEVLDKVDVNALPNVHSWLSGLLNLRGNLVPVFDLLIVLEEFPDQNRRRLFTIGHGEKTVALWINAFPEIKDSTLLRPLKLLPPLPQILKNFVIDGYEQDDQVWLKVKFSDLFKALGHHQASTEEITE
jgi:twitching motility protein PilI